MTTISAHLGYPDDSLEPVISPGRQATITAIVDRLDEVDLALQAGVKDSMAVDIQGLKVDYTEHLGLLRSEGTRLLSQLSALVGLPVAFDKYLGRVPSKPPGSPLSIQSYW